VSEYLWLLGQGVEFSLLVLISPYGWGLLVLAWFTGSRAVRDKSYTLPTWCVLAWPMIMSFICIAWAQKHQRNPGDPGAEGPMMALNLLLLLYVAGSLAIIYFKRPARAATTALLSLGSFLFLGCSFVAAQAITGNWL
jgi:hypothetical protein